MEDVREYTEMVLDEIGENYNIDKEELAEKYLYEEGNKIDEEKEEPAIQFEIIMKNGIKYFRDEYGNIYNEKFEYIEKEEQNRKRAKRKKKS